MGVAGRFFVQLFGTTLCDFGAIMRWWLAVCPGSSSAFGYLLPSLARGFPSRVYPFARYPVASTPARLPPAPLSGGAGGGESGGGDWGVLGCPFWDLAGGGRWDCMAAVLGCCRSIPSCFSCSPPLWGSWTGVFGLTVGPGGMQAVYPPHGMPAVWATHSPGNVIEFRLPTPPGPVGAGGRGGLSSA